MQTKSSKSRERAILIVEDEPPVATFIANLVKSVVLARIEFATNRFQAWELLQASHYDAVVLDLNLGGLNEGRLLLETLKSRMERVPGVVIVSKSGNRPTAKESKAKYPFVVDVLTKNDLEQLLDVFKKALNAAMDVSARSYPRHEGVRRWRLTRSQIMAVVVAMIGLIGAVAAAAIEACYAR